MNIARQRRKISRLIDEAPESHRPYLIYLCSLFDAEVDAGTPQPASQFLPMYHEEFDL